MRSKAALSTPERSTKSCDNRWIGVKASKAERTQVFASASRLKGGPERNALVIAGSLSGACPRDAASFGRWTL